MCFGKNPPNLQVRYYKEKNQKKIKQEKYLELFCLLGGSGLNRLTLFPLYWNDYSRFSCVKWSTYDRKH